jgi:hypothetical protein
MTPLMADLTMMNIQSVAAQLTSLLVVARAVSILH